jgi:ribosome-binding factor A
MPSRRQRKVAELLHKEISQLIQFQTRDPRLEFVTVTDVEVSPDLRQARVYVTTFSDEAKAQDTLAGLVSASGYFRHKLSQSLSLRYIPELTFKLDTSLEHGLHIDELLDSLKEEHETNENSSEAEPND